LQIVNPETTGEDSDYIVITPNSINGNKKILGDRFNFGSKKNLSGYSSQSNRNSQNFINEVTTNDYYFEDQSMAYRQFEILYNPEKSKYYILDNKRGSGTFLKIRNRLVVNKDMIISFCSCHMVLQVFNDGIFNKYKIFIKFYLIMKRKIPTKQIHKNQIYYRRENITGKSLQF
jgi:hypothetical protein